MEVSCPKAGRPDKHDRHQDRRFAQAFPRGNSTPCIPSSAIPLKDFIPGDYTLVISVTDEVAGETATAEVNFLVR